MDMQTAIALLGSNRRRNGDLRPMIKALSLHPWLNSEAQKQRLAAACFVLKRWPQYTLECQKIRNARSPFTER